jgi:hypothetical protein
MPLSFKGHKIKKQMEQEYGKEKGTRIFYAWENKQKRQGNRSMLARRVK